MLQKFQESIDDLSLALSVYKKEAGESKEKKRILFLSVSKAFEVSLEHAWKYLRHKAVEEGLDPQTPKAAVRDAAKMKLIDEPKEWISFINARNTGVHDYFSLPEEDYLSIARDFLRDAKKLVSQ